jgi:hypothetical protein
LSLLLDGGHIPPAPEALPQPKPFGGRPLLTLAELTPGRYVDTIARVVSFRVLEGRDRLGVKPIQQGLLEDRTFRTPFICHRPSPPLERNGVYRIRSAYVHEYPDRSVLLILTEWSGIEALPVEDIEGYVWRPRIGCIPRPIHDVTLEGVVSTIYSASGLVKRCNGCGRLTQDTCPRGCGEGWGWDLRVSARLYDGSGSIKTILSPHITAEVLGRSLGEVLLLASAPQRAAGFDLITYHLALPDAVEVVEAVVEDAPSLRSRDRIMATEGFNLAYFPSGRDLPLGLSEASRRRLDPADPQDSRILRRLIERALESRIRLITGRPLLHGLYLLDEPTPLYGCERAKLYLGFSVRLALLKGRVAVEASPQALVRESVWDYVQWRRGRGASAEAIERALKGYRCCVHLAPLGRLGCIEEVIYRRAGEQAVSEGDRRSLVEFWRDVYGLEVEPDETPLLKVRLTGSGQLFTYPPSKAYFEEGALHIRKGVMRFVEARGASLTGRVRAVLRRALQDLRLGDCALPLLEGEEMGVDAQRLILNDIHRRLLGKRIRARGRVVQLPDQLCFLPRRILRVG